MGLIDHIIAVENLLRPSSHGIDFYEQSDHFPTIAIFRRQSKENKIPI